MVENEDPTEAIKEHLNEHAGHGGDKLASRVALTAAILAVLGAVTALLSGHHANEAMVDQIHAANQWAYYQAKGIKASVLTSKRELLEALGKPASAGDAEKAEQYKKDQEDISEKAREKEHHSEAHLARHLIFARGVTMFQVAIAVAAIAALSHLPLFWYAGLAFGAAGLVFLAQGLIG